MQHEGQNCTQKKYLGTKALISRKVIDILRVNQEKDYLQMECVNMTSVRLWMIWL